MKRFLLFLVVLCLLAGSVAALTEVTKADVLKGMGWDEDADAIVIQVDDFGRDTFYGVVRSGEDEYSVATWEYGSGTTAHNVELSRTQVNDMIQEGRRVVSGDWGRYVVHPAYDIDNRDNAVFSSSEIASSAAVDTLLLEMNAPSSSGSSSGDDMVPPSSGSDISDVQIQRPNPLGTSTTSTQPENPPPLPVLASDPALPTDSGAGGAPLYTTSEFENADVGSVIEYADGAYIIKEYDGAGNLKWFGYNENNERTSAVAFTANQLASMANEGRQPKDIDLVPGLPQPITDGLIQGPSAAAAADAGRQDALLTSGAPANSNTVSSNGGTGVVPNSQGVGSTGGTVTYVALGDDLGGERHGNALPQIGYKDDYTPAETLAVQKFFAGGPRQETGSQNALGHVVELDDGRFLYRSQVSQGGGTFERNYVVSDHDPREETGLNEKREGIIISEENAVRLYHTRAKTVYQVTPLPWGVGEFTTSPNSGSSGATGEQTLSEEGASEYEVSIVEGIPGAVDEANSRSRRGGNARSSTDSENGVTFTRRGDAVTIQADGNEATLTKVQADAMKKQFPLDKYKYTVSEDGYVDVYRADALVQSAYARNNGELVTYSYQDNQRSQSRIFSPSGQMISDADYIGGGKIAIYQNNYQDIRVVDQEVYSSFYEQPVSQIVGKTVVLQSQDKKNTRTYTAVQPLQNNEMLYVGTTETGEYEFYTGSREGGNTPDDFLAAGTALYDMEGNEIHSLPEGISDPSAVGDVVNALRNADGELVLRSELGGEITLETEGGFQGVPQDTSAEAQQAIDEFEYRKGAQDIYRNLQAAAGWSKLSSLFCKEGCWGGWGEQVDKIFHDSFLGVDYWSEAICKGFSDIEGASQNAVFSLTPDGFLYQSATITGTRQKMFTPEGERWLYYVSFFVRNPDAEQSSSRGGNSGDATSATGGATRGTNANSEGLTSDEKKIWNVIKDAGKEISSANLGASTSTFEKLSFNIEFRGAQTADLFDEVAEVDVGDEIAFTNDDSFAQYSTNEYSEVCIVFNDKPVDAFYEEVSEICSPLIDVSESSPTTLQLAEERVQRSSSSSGGRRI